MISSKVDIFSAGVILYQMLTGKKPFGHGQSPAVLLHQSIMKRANGRALDWPAGCQVSAVAREFVSRCLAAQPADRPDISRIFDEPFFTAQIKDEQPPGVKRKRAAAVGGSSGGAAGGADAAAGIGWGR
jgi:serine/threonine protein kinase